MTSPLLQPVQLGLLSLKNRVVMAPLTRCRADNPGFVPTDLMARYYAQRAGAGLIISEATIVSPQGRGYPFTPGIWSAEQVAGWRKVTDAVHAAGGQIVCQLWHCGRLSLPEFHDGAPPVAPSAIDPQWKMFSAKGGAVLTTTPRALSREEIAGIVEDFARGARNAVAAGFDGIEIHSSNGYLFHQFFSRCANTRTDEYGGSIENRTRFFFEVLEATGEALPYGRIGFRLNPMMHGFHGITVDEETVPTWEHIVRRANEYEPAYVHFTEPSTGQLKDVPHAVHDVTGHFRPLARMPIISNGGFDRMVAEEWIEDGHCDAVAFGRLFIGNPDLVKRFAVGAPLVAADAATFYQGGEKGYIDYPALAPA